MPRWTRRNQSLHVAETKLGLTAWRNASRRRKNETFCRVCCQSSNHFNQSDTGLDKEDRLQRSKTGFNQINVTTLFAVRKKEKIGLSWLHWPLAFHFTSSRLFELFLRFLLRLPLFAQKTQNLTLGASANRKSCLFSVCMSCHHSAEGLIFNMFLEPGVTGLLLLRHQTTWSRGGTKDILSETEKRQNPISPSYQSYWNPVTWEQYNKIKWQSIRSHSTLAALRPRTILLHCFFQILKP